jgi:hypothetical protein
MEGEEVTFAVKARYLLTRSDEGVLQLQFASERDDSILRERTTGLPVTK